MATTLDELVVKLKGDISHYEKALKKSESESKKSSSKIQKAFGGMATGAKGVISALTSMKGALAVLGIGALVTKSLNAADSIGKLSGNIGINTKLLQELSFAASQTGVKQEDLNASLMRFNRRMGEAAAGNEQFARAYKQLGVDVTDSSGKIRSAEDVIFDVADAIKNVGDTSIQASTMFTIFGESGFRLVNMFKDGAEKLRGFQREAAELGFILSAEVIKNAEETNDKLDAMSRVVKMQLTSAVVELAPMISAAANGIIGLAGGAKKFMDMLRGVSDVIAAGVGIQDLGTKAVRLQQKLDAARTAVFQIEQAIEKSGNATERQSEMLVTLNRQIKEMEIRQVSIGKVMRSNTLGQEQSVEADNAKNAATAEAIKLQKDLKSILEQQAKGGLDPAAKLQKEIEMLERAMELQREFNSVKIADEEDLLAALNERRQAQAEQEILDHVQQIEYMKALNANLYADDIARHENAIKTKEKGLSAHSKMRWDLALRDKKAHDELMRQQLNAYATMFGGIMNLAQGSSKAAFELAKAGATATAIVEGIVAVQKAEAAAPPPFNIPLIAAATVSTAARVAAIVGTNYQPPGYQRGIDSVPGIGLGDRQPAMLEAGERVVPRSTNRMLSDFLRRQSMGETSGEQRVTIRLQMTDDFMDLIDAKLVERDTVGVSLEVS